jgi:transcription-repair coupling factor (superfamily II helicase)
MTAYDIQAPALSGLLERLHLYDLGAVKALSEDPAAGLVDLGALPPGGKVCYAAALNEALPERPLVLLAADGEEAEALAASLASFSAEVLLYPAWELLPYEVHSPERLICAERLEVLHSLCQGFRGVLVTTPRALARKVPPASELFDHSLVLEPELELSPAELSSRLSALGYRRVNLVEAPGEFARRGGLFDLFPGGAELPVRLDYFGDVIEGLSAFDPGDQRSRAAVESLALLPLRELVPERENIERLLAPLPRGELRTRLEALLHREPFFDGVEYLLARMYESLVPPLDYFTQRPLVMVGNPTACRLAVERFNNQVVEQYERRNEEPPLVDAAGMSAERESHALERLGRESREDAGVSAEATVPVPPSPPEALFTDPGELLERAPIEPNLVAQSVEHYRGRLGKLFQDLRTWDRRGASVVLCCQTSGKSERLGEILAEEALDVPVVTCEFVGGVELPGRDLVLVTDEELFGRTTPLSRRRKVKPTSMATFRALDIRPGDYVVHGDHGVGRYLRLATLTLDGEEADFVELAFRDGAKLFVPIWNLGRIERYEVGEGSRVNLDKLGGSRWKKARSRVKREIAGMAAELIAVHARRRTLPGHAYQPDGPWQRELEESFPFTDTPDQEKATREVKGDLEAPRPMDRLLCGDVGFGKTEVAVRAAFKAAVEGKQVAVLAPTTILADQHYETFSERLSPFPVRVAVLSRFVPQVEQQRILQKLHTGEVDILVGTHRLLSRDVRFRDLGLLIVDEEQRFGVKHKERLKQLQSAVDVLTMTATPIPRTLYLALAGARDISNIETPPVGRLPIKTFIGETSNALIREAVERELERGGQVFFLHNRVQSIQEVTLYLQELLPEVRFGIAHGQLAPRRLESVIHDFVNHAFDVLVTTTIIENGIDIPNVNTIIINRADRFGLAQLYQLRGRVGRGRHRAYAYLFTPPRRVLPEPAFKRLRAVAEFNELGSGLRLAQRDLELRGAGDVLGQSQSGFIEQVGFDLYVRLLKEAVAELQGEERTPEPTTEVKGDFSAYLPDDYVGGSELKIQLYRRLAEIRSLSEAVELRREFADRFGDPPRPAERLFTALEIKLLGSPLGLREARVDGRRLRLAFDDFSRVGRVDLSGCRAVRDLRTRLDGRGRGELVVRPVGDPLEAAREIVGYLQAALSD